MPLGQQIDFERIFYPREALPAMVILPGLQVVELGKIAASKAQTTSVKQFAERMVTDHTKANKALQVAAGHAGIAVPQKMTADHQKEFNRFKNYTGSNFDRDYVNHMVKDHEDDVAAFTRAAKEAKNSQIREFAANSHARVRSWSVSKNKAVFWLAVVAC